MEWVCAKISANTDLPKVAEYVRVLKLKDKHLRH
jgi:hypothetical protein